MRLNDLIDDKGPPVPGWAAPHMLTLGAVLHQREVGESLVQKMNRLQGKIKPPPPDPHDITPILEAQRAQNKVDRMEFRETLRGRRIAATDPAAAARFAEWESQLLETTDDR